MNTMETAEGLGDLVRTWYQEMPKNPDIDHDKYFFDLRMQSTVNLFFNKASILHSNLFRMTYEALKHHGFDRPRRLPLNSRYLRKVAWLI